MLEMLIDNDTHAALPEAVRAEYTGREGQFQLDVEGVYSRADRDALQGSLAAERQAHKDTKGKFVGLDGVTRDQVEQVWNTAAERGIRLEELDGQGDLEERAGRLADQRVTAQVRPLERMITTLTEERDGIVIERDKLVATRDAVAVTGAVLEAFSLKSIGGVTAARPDVEAWASNFQLQEDGSVVTRENIAGIAPGISPKEAFGDLRKDGLRDHWFKESKGGGARPGAKIEKADNPFTLLEGAGPSRVKNLTACMAEIKNDPDRAKRMCSDAGALNLFRTAFPAAR